MIDAGSVLNGRYKRDRSVGQGGFARVFLATDLVLHRRVAIKVLLPDLAGSNDERDFMAHFAAEARFIAALDHPNILAVHDYGESDGTPYLVMPHIEGGTLHYSGQSPVARSYNQSVQRILALL
jgi:eukaryotic-like serine/threonine-protein kinase